MSKIVVPIDTDDICLQTITLARTLLEEGEELHLLHVIRPIQSQAVIHYVGRQRLEQFQRESAEEGLKQTLEQVDKANIPYSLQIEFGDPAHVITEHAKKHDVVVMGTHRHGPISGFFLGSVSNSALKSLSCPVILVPNTKSEGDGKKILVALDGSKAAHRAAEQSALLAKKTGALCILLHVVTPPMIYSPLANGLEWVERSELLNIGETVIDQHEQLFLDYQIPYVKKVVIGNPAQMIKEVADQEKVGLIAMGHYGLNMIAETIMGSVPYKVIHQTNIPLLIVK